MIRDPNEELAYQIAGAADIELTKYLYEKKRELELDDDIEIYFTNGYEGYLFDHKYEVKDHAWEILEAKDEYKDLLVDYSHINAKYYNTKGDCKLPFEDFDLLWHNHESDLLYTILHWNEFLEDCKKQIDDYLAWCKDPKFVKNPYK